MCIVVIILVLPYIYTSADIPSLLQQLGLEHYQERFEQEELDFDTLLTMSESDLKEIGVNTLGARRKIQIAISGRNSITCNHYVYLVYIMWLGR